MRKYFGESDLSIVATADNVFPVLEKIGKNEFFVEFSPFEEQNG